MQISKVGSLWFDKQTVTYTKFDQQWWTLKIWLETVEKEEEEEGSHTLYWNF